MNYFLIDYENVHVAGFEGVTKLTDNDCVVIFYSENADTMTFDLHIKINESKANFQLQKVAVKEKNALDFQLCTYLGFLSRDKLTDDATDKNFYYVVSNDKGYSVLPEYLKKFGIDVRLVSNVAKDEVKVTPPPPKPQVVQVQPAKPAGELEKALSKVLNNSADIPEVVKNINALKTRTDVNNYLGQKFNSPQKGGEIYRAIKPFISDKK